MSSLIATNVASRQAEEVRQNFHRYLLEDVATLLSPFVTKELSSADEEEVRARVDFLRASYDHIQPGQFGIRASIYDRRLGVYIFPV